jgi:hypothetical protein
MLHPAEDTEDRSPLWDYMQNFWMDTDPGILLPEVSRVCAESKYSLDELEAIYWNEVRPAVKFNMFMLPAPEWAGFELGWLKERVLKKQRYGKPLPWKWLHPYSDSWWRKLRAGIVSLRSVERAS